MLLLLCAFHAIAQDTGYELKKDIPYYDNAEQASDRYIRVRCKLDVYYPKDTADVATVVWFHGGGLEGGEKELPDGLKEKGLIVVSVNYRLHPKVRHPAYIEDAAAAVAWTFRNIERYNGSSKKIFISGHSAGGYLASMVGLDKGYMENYQLDADSIAGLIPFSGHAITHFTIRSELGIPGTQPTIDEYAPLFHVRKDAPPMLLITGGRELELLGRYEENAYFYRMMKEVGHTDIELLELDGYGHNMVYPAIPLLINFVNRVSANLDAVK